MKYGIYTIYDKVAEISGPVFQAKNDSTAIRILADLVMRTDVVAEDYEMYRIGTFDDETREMVPEKGGPVEDLYNRVGLAMICREKEGRKKNE